MKANTNTNILNSNLFRITAGTAAVLLIPLLANWPWELFDYIIMGSLIFGTGLMYELTVKALGKKNRVLIALILLAALAVVWAELAVGIFGTPFAGS